MDTNLMPPPNIAPPKRSTPKAQSKGESDKADDVNDDKNDIQMKVESTTATIGGEKEKEVPHEQKEGDEKEKKGDEKENKGEEKESKGDEKDTKGEKEKWKEPENVEMMYTPPEWSSAPKHSFFIDVLKNGTIVETIDLSKKEHFLIGRLPFCDVTFDHPSVSRQHAVLQNRDTGALYIYDLGSTHRTVVNKRPIPPKVHYVIRIGDVIKIGQSTRQFIVGGSPEVEKEQRDALERQRANFLRKKLEDQVQIKTYTPLIDLFTKKDSSSAAFASMRADTATWGMDFDDDAVYAADNPEEEVFMGNEDDAEAYIKKGKKDAKKGAGQHKHSKHLGDDEDDSGDDEFFDRTLQKNEEGLAKVETYESLVAKKEEFAKQKDELTAELRAVRSSGSTSNEEDSLDAFMSSNSESILGDKRKRIQAKIADVDKEQAKLERLIKLAAPALKPVAPPPKKPEAKPDAKLTQNSAAAASKTGPALGGKAEEKSKKTSRPLQTLDADIPEEYRVKIPEKEEDEEEKKGEEEVGGKAVETTKKEEKPEAKEGVEKEVPGEAEEANNEEGEKGKSRTAVKRERQREKQKQREEDDRKKQKLEEFESKYDAWVPPKAQSGDGRTKLNDLYGY